MTTERWIGAPGPFTEGIQGRALSVRPAPPESEARRIVSLRSRLERLERAPDGRRCPECMLRPQDKGYIVVDGRDPVPDLSEVCPECGRNTRLYIEVVYEGEEGEG